MSASFGSLVNKYKRQKTEATPVSASLSSSASSSAASHSLSRAEQLLRYNIISIAFKCHEGSVTHYYHFFFSALVPLVEYHLTRPRHAFRIVSDIGPFKSVLTELPLNIFEVLGPTIPTTAVHDDKSLPHTLEKGVLVLPAYDVYNSQLYSDPYVSLISPSTRQRILDYFSSSIPSYIKHVAVPPVLLIRRARDTYYSSACIDRTSIYQTSGAARRSITNHDELLSALQHKFGASAVADISLERTSIYYQYRIFSEASVVIAQHGAALANIFFMRNDALVVEISPPWSRSYAHFKNLAHHSKVQHRTVEQDQDHSSVNIEAVLDCLHDVNIECSVNGGANSNKLEKSDG